jgi:prepilin-type N-terminal cleavage/methylation domain-containing protein
MHVARHITNRRTGFTLIELLVVVLIIAILAGLSWAVLGRTGSAARVAATRSTLQQLDSIIAERIEAFRRHDFRNQAATFKVAYDAAGNTDAAGRTPAIVTRQAAERMIRKDRFRAAFPSRFEDLFGLDGVDGDVAGSSGSFSRDWTGSPTPHLTDADFADIGAGDDAPLTSVILQLLAGTRPPLASRNLSNAQTYFDPEQHDPVTESSELLYLALTRGAMFGASLDSLDGIDADRFQDEDKDGLIEILDDWDNPIRFYNYPTALMRADTDLSVFDPGAANVLVDDLPQGTPDPLDIPDWTNTDDYTSPLKQDPDDPFGELAFYFSSYSLDGTNAWLGFGQTDPTDFLTEQGIFGGPNRYHISNTWHSPLLVSCGPNEELGLGEPTAPDASRFAFADLTDGAGGSTPNGVIDTSEIEHLGDNITNHQQAGGN